MFERLDDTIVAISSPPGVSVRGIVRLSGPEAFGLAGEVFACADGSSLVAAPGHRRLRGRVRIGTGATVPAEAYTFRAPASYTRQEVVELHTVGSPPLLAMVLEQLTGKGARLAEPGEFTARAYFAGAMDLTRVEGVAAVIHARNDSQLRASQALLYGVLSRRSTQLRDQLTDLLALLEAQIDFAEEPIEFIPPQQVQATLKRVIQELDWLLEHSASAERLEVLPEVMLVGPPNAGKSTLFNRLTGLDRAIQSATAGTTRDVLSAPLSVPGGEVMLLDSAGLGAPLTAGGHEGDGQCWEAWAPAQLAVEATRRCLASADLVLLVVDVTDKLGQAVAGLRPALAGKPTRIVANKIDALVADQLPRRLGDLGPPGEVVAVSAITGQGVGELQAAISAALFADAPTHGVELLALSNRQRDALREARAALARARAIGEPSNQADIPTELLALEVHEAMDALSLLVGRVTTEDLLGRIFSRFCIGK